MTWTEGPIDGVVLRPAVAHKDARGWLAEIFRSDEFPADTMPAMGYISVTKPGMTRGPHEHAKQTDCFAFFGPGRFKLYLWDPREKSPSRGRRMTVEVGEANPMIVTVPPGVVHGYKNVSKTDGWVVNLPNRLYAGTGRREAVDEIRYEDDKSHRFLMEK